MAPKRSKPSEEEPAPAAAAAPAPAAKTSKAKGGVTAGAPLPDVGPLVTDEETTVNLKVITRPP